MTFAAALLLIATTAIAKDPKPAAMTPDQVKQALGETCPMTVPGTSVAAAGVKGGMALSFSTTVADRVPELQSKVSGLADLDKKMQGAGGMVLVKTMPSVKKTPDGAQLVLKPKKSSQLELLKSRATTFARQMQQSGQCQWSPNVP